MSEATGMLTTAEVAARLSVSEDTVLRIFMREPGVLRIKNGARTLYRVSSAEASDLMTATFREKRKLSPSDYTAAENNAAKADESSIEQRGMIIPEVMDKELDAIFGDKDEDLRPELKQLNKSMKEDLFRLGRLLVEYKKIVPYGKWYDFLKSIGVHDRQARRWMELATIKSDVAKYLPSRSDMGTDLTANGHPDTTKTKQAFKEAVKIAQTMVNEKSAANPDAEFGVALTEEEQDQAWEAGKTKVGLQTSDIGKAVEDSSKEQGVEEVALQIADMLIIRLRSLKTDTDQRAAMNKAIEYVRHQGLLQPIKRSE